jgi:hypothetical protein
MSDYYFIVNANSGLALAVKDASKTHNADVVQYPRQPLQDAAYQLWTFAPNLLGNGEFGSIHNKNSGLVLDVQDGSAGQGKRAVQNKENPRPPENQLWKFTSVDFPEPEEPLRTLYWITNKKSGYVLDVAGGSNENNAPVVQWHAHSYTVIPPTAEFPVEGFYVQNASTDNQLWYLIDAASGVEYAGPRAGVAGQSKPAP